MTRGFVWFLSLWARECSPLSSMLLTTSLYKVPTPTYISNEPRGSDLPVSSMNICKKWKLYNQKAPNWAYTPNTVCRCVFFRHLILSSSSLPAFDLSQHQDLFKWVSSLHQVWGQIMAPLLYLCSSGNPPLPERMFRAALKVSPRLGNKLWHLWVRDVVQMHIF